LTTVNDPVTFPFIMLQEDPACNMLAGLVVRPQLVSVTANPLPVTVTPVPNGPSIGVTAIVGPRFVTVKVALATSVAVVPVTVIVYVPPAALGKTVNEPATFPLFNGRLHEEVAMIEAPGLLVIPQLLSAVKKWLPVT